MQDELVTTAITQFREEWSRTPDEELVQKVHDGGSDAADAMDFMLERYKDLVRIKTRPFFLLGADRADLIQEGMIGLYKAIISYQPDKNASFRSFADLCISRQIMTAVKNANRLKHWPLNSYVSLNRTIYDEEDKETTMMDILTQPGVAGPEDMLIDQEQVDHLQEEIDARCSKFEKKVLSMYLNGHDYHQIAAAMGKTPKSIDNALQRIKRKVGQIAAEW
ncbi:MAG: RNA polymerase sporulation sigma factor SigH [Firmicutes bacterium]|nr:RNA polymerase sporulation sigma factor SigH [Bacillota bacterium]